MKYKNIKLPNIDFFFFSFFLIFSAVLIFLFDLNQFLFLFLNKSLYVLGEYLWGNLTLMGDTLFTLIVILTFSNSEKNKVFSFFKIGLLLAITIQGLKHGLNIPRPPHIFSEDINVIGRKLLFKSFPSGHTATAFFMLGFFAIKFQTLKPRLFLFVLALIIGISRIAVGAHWPLDILIGGALGWSFCLLYKGDGTQTFSKNKNYLIQAFYFSLLVYFVFYNSRYEGTFLFQALLCISSLLVYFTQKVRKILSP